MTADKLKARREALGLSQSEMAEALRVPLRTYQGWESAVKKKTPIPDIVVTAINGDFKKRLKKKTSKK